MDGEGGWAVAYRRYSTRYVKEENAAREAMRGIWRCLPCNRIIGSLL